MNILVCLYFSAFLFGHYRRSLTEGSLEMPGVSPLYDLCPYTNYCTRNASKRLKDDTKTACCGYCSCSDNCWKRGNCCVDKQNIIVKQPLESCVEVMVKTGGFHGKPKNLPRYYVIQSCPMTNDTLTENCSGNVQSSLEDFIWVTDERTNKLYNNKYCAECHGVVNYIKWKVGTDCLVPMDGQKSPTDVINGVISMCSLFVLPPEGTDERVNRCFVSELGTCNVTRKWQNYDQALETACNDFNQIYYQEDGFQAYYKNVYCFLCNSRDQEVKDVCTASIQPISKTDLIGFTAILDFDLIESEKEARADDEAKQSRVCPIDEIKDPFQEGCLKLTCPMLYAPVYGTCKKSISSTSLLGLSATLKLYLERSMINLSSATSKFQIENIGETLFKKLRRKLGLIERKCQIREEGLCGTFDNKSIPELFAIRIRYTTSEYCQEDFLIDRIQWLLNNTIKVQFDKEFFSLSAVAFSPLEYFDYCTNARDHYHVGKLLLLEYIDFQRFSRCRSVLLNVDHYTNLMKKASESSQRRKINSLFNLTTLGSNVTLGKENLTVHVCFESYSSVLWKANHGMSYFCMKTMLVVMSLLSSVFNIFIPRICNILQSL